MASKSELCLQAVDYYSWALYRKWESDDPTQLERLGDNIVVVSGGVSRWKVSPSQSGLLNPQDIADT